MTQKALAAKKAMAELIPKSATALLGHDALREKAAEKGEEFKSP